MFKGVIFDVWQWEQEMFDGSKATFEKVQRVNTAVVIPIIGDKILIVEQEQPQSEQKYLSFAGGRCERDEDPLEAAKRELLEETGMEATSWALLKEVRPSHKVVFTVYFYIAKHCRKVQKPALDSGERLHTKLITFDEFLELSENPRFDNPEILADLFKARLHDDKREELKKALFA